MTPFQTQIGDWIGENSSTPDVPFLETQDYWPVFTYSEKKGKLSPYFTHGESLSEFLSIGWTSSAIYSILNVQVGSTHYHLADLSGTDRILGEVWVLPTEVLMDLDCEERNLYHKKRIPVPIKVAKGKTILAWMYIAHPDLLRNGPVRISKYGRYTYYGKEKYLEVI
jgi:gamma-glutamylcyclotransferase (GGCT)/AIG2-like uncharacterized protein YtfP